MILENYKNFFPDHIEKYKTDFYFCYEFALNKGIKISGITFICPMLELVQYNKKANVKIKVFNTQF